MVDTMCEACNYILPTNVFGYRPERSFSMCSECVMAIMFVDKNVLQNRDTYYETKFQKGSY